jgi:hypothetical protein
MVKEIIQFVGFWYTMIYCIYTIHVRQWDRFKLVFTYNRKVTTGDKHNIW